MIDFALTAIYAIIFGIGIAPWVETVKETAQKTQALEEQGFDNVDLEGNYFTASRDGDYFSGVLLGLRRTRTRS